MCIYRGVFYVSSTFSISSISKIISHSAPDCFAGAFSEVLDRSGWSCAGLSTAREPTLTEAEVGHGWPWIQKKIFGDQSVWIFIFPFTKLLFFW